MKPQNGLLLILSLLTPAVTSAADGHAKEIAFYSQQLLRAVSATMREDAEQQVDDAAKLLRTEEKSHKLTYDEHDDALKSIDAAVSEAKYEIQRQYSAAAPRPTPTPGELVNATPTYHIRKTSDPISSNFDSGAKATYDRSPTKETYMLAAGLVVNLAEQTDLNRRETIGYQFGTDVDVSSDKASNPGKIVPRFTRYVFQHYRDLGTMKDDESGFANATWTTTFADFMNRNLRSKSMTAGFLVQPVYKQGSWLLNAKFDTGLGRMTIGSIVGFEVGKVTAATSKPQPENDWFTRVVTPLQFELMPLGSSKLRLYASETARWLGDDHFRPYSYFNAGVEVKLTESWSVTFDHTLGRDQPTFKMASKRSAGFTFKN